MGRGGRRIERERKKTCLQVEHVRPVGGINVGQDHPAKHGCHDVHGGRLRVLRVGTAVHSAYRAGLAHSWRPSRSADTTHEPKNRAFFSLFFICISIFYCQVKKCLPSLPVAHRHVIKWQLPWQDFLFGQQPEQTSSATFYDGLLFQGRSRKPVNPLIQHNKSFYIVTNYA